jgi:hypothetical protein
LCLSVPQRQVLLDESGDEADRGARECARRRGLDAP